MQENLQPVVPLPGHDHATLALIPFPGVADRHQPVHIAYQAVVDGRPRYTDVTLLPGVPGLPLPGDHIIMLALLQELVESGDAREQMPFNQSSVFERLGWSDGGKNYDRLREALERLVGCTIKVRRRWVSRTGREYKQSDGAVGIVDSYHISKGGDECWVEWGRVIREAIELGDIKRLDWGLVRSLGSSSAVQLYRFVDRAVLAGETQLEVDWTTLATAIGMATGYTRPAAFKANIQAYLDQLVERGYLDRWDYARGGTFTFHMPNYLRAQLRQMLAQHGVYPEAARQLVAGFDELAILLQVDNLPFRGAREPGAFLVRAIQESYPLQYPDDERDAFLGMWDLLLSDEHQAYHQAALRLLGESLFDSINDPAEWSVECRAVVRAMVTHNVDPERC